MHSRNEEVIRLPHEAVGNVHHKGSWYWSSPDPSALLAEDLESAAVVFLGDDGKALDISMCAYAGCISLLVPQPYSTG